MIPATVRYVRLYTGDDGQAQFEDLEFTLAPQEFAPPAPAVDVSEPVEASAFMVLRSPAGWTDAAHPAPARQFMIVLAGSLEVSTRGETRVLSAGDMILVEDTTGPGHGATVLEDLAMAVVRAPSPDP
jgi:mannose-6-phosphate isomerase-like protein (cupin superfamily)